MEWRCARVRAGSLKRRDQPLRMAAYTAISPSTEHAVHTRTSDVDARPAAATEFITTRQNTISNAASPDMARRMRWRLSVVSIQSAQRRK